MTVVVAIAAAAVAFAATAYALDRLLAAWPLRRANYRGVRVPTGMGAVALAGVMVALGFLALVSEISASATAAGVWGLPLAAAAGFAVLGLFDDVAGSLAHGPEHGFRGHAGALARGGLTTGGFKLVAGSALGFALAAPATDGFGLAILGGVVIALSANLLNCFDLRPGRAAKAFIAGGIPLAIVAGPLRATVCAALGAVTGFLRADVRERAMLGDAGSNAFGAFLGACAVLLSSRGTLLGVALALALLQIVAEGPSLSRAIEVVPPLRAADRWGRVPEQSPPASVGADSPSD